MENIKKTIRTIPHFPMKGIMFRDITTLLKDANAFKETIDALVDRYRHQSFDVVAGIESRGFIIAGVIAYLLGKGFMQKPIAWITSWNMATMLSKCTKIVLIKEAEY
jgi:adenine phosphoribosyltransferase